MNGRISEWKAYCCIKQLTKDETITASHEPFGHNRYINLNSYINQL